MGTPTKKHQEKNKADERNHSFGLSVILRILNPRLFIVSINGLFDIPKGGNKSPETAAHVLQRLQVRALDSLSLVFVPEIRIKEAGHQRNQRESKRNVVSNPKKSKKGRAKMVLTMKKVLKKGSSFAGSWKSFSTSIEPVE